MVLPVRAAASMDCKNIFSFILSLKVVRYAQRAKAVSKQETRRRSDASARAERKFLQSVRGRLLEKTDAYLALSALVIPLQLQRPLIGYGEEVRVKTTFFYHRPDVMGRPHLF